ncbi:S-adenosyl-L-methionine-dependent methyltransferase [Microdochium trichocladiopsis]|uniref:tRNA(Phe) (4-demethylwyosine(37)-C(7)) aminocarboxypropyltransferase n=1 Tax=Microdochium trichocladiopsis TaxID=1682393 RepID=A0A9P8YGG8_9PEZI|nr:S-adenosyl-L-methionine-dependent methyltransferase [Microdochium trichocladiopsis]KAH7039949.1 S-adenosyl-L-methionine-dependent methyltransferase [Microdochium trichocladiopsis]
MTQRGEGTVLRDHKKDRSKRKPASQNPVEAAVLTWRASLPTGAVHDAEHAAPISSATLIAQAPKRWTVYEPMILLPTGSFSSAAWAELLKYAGQQQGRLLQDLWCLILAEITRKTGAKQPLTHLAINEGIPLVRDEDEHQHQDSKDNILRSPTGLAMLHGDFGPASTQAGDNDECGHGQQSGNVTDEDFQNAFWVSTKQNGICQTWAPRWTMFSRGNIKEKARLLDFHTPKIDHPNATGISPPQQQQDSSSGKTTQSSTTPMARTITKQKLQDSYAVDMYAGIGYFVFSYARLGLRVLCWELNPWSVEGLRRGAEANGWSVRIIRSVGELARPTGELVHRRAPSQQATHVPAAKGRRNVSSKEEAQIVVFLEDNIHAARRIAELRAAWTNQDNDTDDPLEILHVNGGLLPVSTGSWAGAWDITCPSRDAWLHLHENVGVADIERRKGEIERWFRDYQDQQQQQKAGGDVGSAGRRSARVEHVELVKTFAPGVWHCVFDVYATSRKADTGES